MPGCLTHWLFSTAALENAPLWAVQQRSVVLAAGQGTDPFFFYGRIPWRKRLWVDEAAAFGSLFHAGHPRLFFKTLFESASFQAPQFRDAAFSLTLGLLYHWQLDRTVHPYIYSRSGFNARGQLDEFWAGRHARFESVADAAFAFWHIQSKAALKIPPPYQVMHLGDSVFRPLSAWLADVFPQSLTPLLWHESLQDMRTVYRFLSDRSGWLSAVFAYMNKMESFPGALLYPRHPSPKRDSVSLNTGNDLWLEPVTGTGRTESLPDLFDQSLSEVFDLHALIERTRDSGYASCAADWDHFYRDTNHEGCRPGEIMRFTSIVRL